MEARMSHWCWLRACAGLTVLLAGCRSTLPVPNILGTAPAPVLGHFEASAAPQHQRLPARREVLRQPPENSAVPTAGPVSHRSPAPVTIVPATHQQQPSAEPIPPASAPIPPTVADDDGLVVEGDQLSLDQLVAEVEARNPSLQAIIAAWQAAAEKYPQAVALDDPMFMAMLAPGALGNASVPGGYMLEMSQRFPWPGKRRLRGDVVQSEADAGYHEAEDFRVQLALLTQMAYYDYYLVLQEQRLNRENTEIMQRFRETAQVRYQNNRVTQQDVLQADVELAELERRGLELKRMQRVAISRINTLLLRQPDAPLPKPAALPVPVAPEDASLLIGIALSRRQDLAALAHRIEAEEAGLDLAYKQFYPDVDLVGRYDTFWEQADLRGAVGVELNVPIYRGKLRAAVYEAEFRVSQRLREYEQKQIDIQHEVQAAYERVEESRQTVELYRQKLIPFAGQNVAAAQANYENTKATFLDLAIAQRQLVELQEKEQEALVSYRQRQAELERAVGGR